LWGKTKPWQWWEKSYKNYYGENISSDNSKGMGKDSVEQSVNSESALHEDRGQFWRVILKAAVI